MEITGAIPSRTRIAHALACLTIAGLQQTVQAAALEEVFVTAQKRVESAQDTPISMAAFSSEMLERKGITNLTDVHAKVPNFQLTPHPNSASTSRVFIRGIGNNDDQITMDPSVAIYLDGVYMARSQGLAMEVADIERIEVLRGPQGSLYGRNATGGAVNFHTKAPRVGEFGFRQDLSFGNRDLLRTRTSVNLPLGESAAMDLTWLRHEQDGYVTNRGTGVSRFGDRDREAWRTALLWDAADNVQFRYTYDRSGIDDTPEYLVQVPFFPAQGERPRAGSPAVRDLEGNDILTQGHNLTLDWELWPSLALKSITAYRELDNRTYQDYHTGAFAPLPLFTSAWDQRQDQFTQEFQLIGDALDGRLEYVAGLYYFDESADSRDFVQQPLRNYTSRRSIQVENSAFAVFGQATWRPDLWDSRLSLTLGVRWSEDEREAELRDIQSVGGQVVNVVSGSGDNDFSDFSPSLIVGWDLADATNLYAKVVTGYKTGGFNIRASSMQRFEEGFDQEELVSWEIGIKSQFLENRVRLNAAVFRADYDDIQLGVSDPLDPTRSDILNAGKATIDGFELDVSAMIGEGLQVSAGYGYVNPVYEKVLNSEGENIYRQYQFIGIPEHSWNAELEYRRPMQAGVEVVFTTHYGWHGERFGGQSNDRRYRVDEYGLLDARLSIENIRTAGGEFRAAVWGRNIEDKAYYASHFNAGVPTAIFGQPRSYGLDLIYEF